MKASVYIFWCCMVMGIPFGSYAQTFQINNYQEKHPSGEVYTFPILTSIARQAAAQKINTLLQKAELQIAIDPSKKGAFSNLWPPENSMGGTTDYSYEVHQNNDRYFSISFAGQGCGAYCEGYTNYYNYDAQTGEPITITSLFSPQGLAFISKYVLHKKNKMITDVINDLNKKIKENPGDKGDYQSAIEMFQDCKLQESDSPSFDYAGLLLSDEEVSIQMGRCSNHAMLALDDIGDFIFKFPVQDFNACLSPYGLAILNSSSSGNRDYKTYSGTLNNTIKITAFLPSPSSDQEVNGLYFYNRFAGIIQVKGTKQGNQFTFIESDEKGNQTGKFQLTLTGNTFSGKWINPKTLKELPVTLNEN